MRALLAALLVLVACTTAHASVAEIAVSDRHPAQKLADEARAHLIERNYSCATKERQLVVPGFRHVELPLLQNAVAEQRFDGSIVVNRKTLRDSKRKRVRGGWRYNADAVDTMLHEQFHLCSGGDDEALVTIASEIETHVFCAQRLRRCSKRHAYYEFQVAELREKIGRGKSALKRVRALLKR